MKLNRLRVCEEVSQKLSFLKARTGLTPNILCRIGFSLSINDSTVPSPDDYPADGDKEIDRHVLTGMWDPMFVAFIRQRCFDDGLGLNDDIIAAQFRAHVNRGVILLFKRVKSIGDLALLMPRETYQGLRIAEKDVSDESENIP